MTRRGTGMSHDDPLGIATDLAALETEARRLWALKDANARAARRNEDRIDAQLRQTQARIDGLRAARLDAHRADIALNRAARERRTA